MENHEKIEELVNDLEEAIEKIDFKKYDPLGKDVQAVLNISGLIHAVCHHDLGWDDDEECEEYMHEHEKHEEHKKKIDVDDEHDKYSENYEIFKHIQEELRDAEKYYQMYLKHNKDASIKKIALQECEHANLFINQARLAHKTPKESEKLQALMKHYNELKDKIESA